MSQNTQSKQSILNHWEKQEQLAMQEEEHWIKAGNTLRAQQCRLFRNRFNTLKEQYTVGKDSKPIP